MAVDSNKTPIIAYESYEDAKIGVATMFGAGRVKFNKHCMVIPLCISSVRNLDSNNVKDVIDTTILATISAYEAISEKLGEKQLESQEGSCQN